MDLLTLIPASYRASRQRFRAGLERVRADWPAATHSAHPAGEHPDLSTDWLQADAREQRERLFILTTAEHGIEGYVGSAVMQLFWTDFLPRLNPATDGMLLVHALNPWGMEHRARVNSSNVDLNRSFVEDPRMLDPAFNPDYTRLGYLLKPRGPVKSPRRSAAAFGAQWARAVLTLGEKRVERATLLGQYVDPRGLHFGGQALQDETRFLMDLVRRCSTGYPQVVWVDVHTGYGPRERMTLVLSAGERASTPEIRRRLGYPTLAKADGAEFYAMRGDMLDCAYRVFEHERPQARFFALAFEFGTLGEDLRARLRGMRATVLENQLRHYGATTPQAERWVRREFAELFLPSEPEWYVRATADTRQAFSGILADGGFLARP
jgi:hypothetical protein